MFWLWQILMPSLVKRLKVGPGGIAWKSPTADKTRQKYQKVAKILSRLLKLCLLEVFFLPAIVPSQTLLQSCPLLSTQCVPFHKARGRSLNKDNVLCWSGGLCWLILDFSSLTMGNSLAHGKPNLIIFCTFNHLFDNKYSNTKKYTNYTIYYIM